MRSAKLKDRPGATDPKSHCYSFFNQRKSTSPVARPSSRYAKPIIYFRFKVKVNNYAWGLSVAIMTTSTPNIGRSPQSRH